MIDVCWKASERLAIGKAKNRSHSCFFHPAALPLTNVLCTFLSHQELLEGACCTKERAQQALSQGLHGAWGHGWRWPGTHPRRRALSSCTTQAAISACHVISGVVFRTVRLGGSVSFPRGCDRSAVGDLWQAVLGKCCARLGAEWLREAINSLRWEAYIASITRIINFAF